MQSKFHNCGRLRVLTLVRIGLFSARCIELCAIVVLELWVLWKINRPRRFTDYLDSKKNTALTR